MQFQVSMTQELQWKNMNTVFCENEIYSENKENEGPSHGKPAGMAKGFGCRTPLQVLFN